ncbi:DUF421 domain-containing protein [Bacillus sp. FJAT-44742]|uniref:DUF421 domain-containing protein n=1 Tax=Bacillus sp. FJAT-44742 TaxID=2014005 RepID=UPI000C248D5A|nr:DUF421 domain-containing protein [Bacillus sp. FJAT-44742]
MNTNYAFLTVELLIGFFALLVVTKLLGKTQITQLTPFDFISALVLGELVGNAIYDKEIHVTYVLYAIFVWTVLISTIEKITQKFKRSRNVLEGKPTIVIRNGQLDYEALQSNKLDINQLQHLLRDKDIFSLKDVQYAILEANGSVSVMKADRAATPTKEDLNIPKTSSYLPMSVILDGEWVEDNLKEINWTKDQILNELNKAGIPNIRRVLYAEWNGSLPLHIQKYE